jgi:hypothetical protein
MLLFLTFFAWYLVWKYGNSEWFPQLALAALFSTFTNTIVDMILINYELLAYPQRLIPHMSNISITFGYAVFPVVHVFYYQCSFSMNWVKAALLAVLIAASITISETIFEHYTDLIRYTGWTWYYSVGSIWLTLVLTRWTVRFWFRSLLETE